MDSRAQKPHESKTGKKSPCDQHTSPTAKPPEPDTSYARGGRVKKTGAAKLHKDEVVLPVAVIQFCPIQIIAFTPCLEDILILIMNASKKEMNFMMCIIKRQ